MANREKICFIASSGGHVQEISWLFDLCDEYDSFLVTERGDFQKEYAVDRTYYFNKIDRREKRFFLHFLQLIGNSVKIMRKRFVCNIRVQAKAH